MKRLALPALVLSLGLLGACSSSGGGDASPPLAGSASAGGSATGSTPSGTTSDVESSSGGGPTAPAKACSLFTAAKINSAFSVSVGPGTIDNTSENSCKWAHGDAPVFMVTIIKTAETDLSNELATVKSYSKTPEKLGDDSAFLSPIGGSDETSLIVVKSGFMYQFVIYRGNGTPEAKDKISIIALAKPIFA